MIRRCIFKIVDNEAHYVKDYEEDTLAPGEVIVSFTHDNFRDHVHIDDGDWKCLKILFENGMRPIITR